MTNQLDCQHDRKTFDVLNTDMVCLDCHQHVPLQPSSIDRQLARQYRDSQRAGAPVGTIWPYEKIGAVLHKVQCIDCGWQGFDYELKAQACPVCDGRCADV